MKQAYVAEQGNGNAIIECITWRAKLKLRIHKVYI